MGVQINGSTGNVIATKGTFSGNVGIAGTLTYEDVTDIDAVGLITARSGIEVGASPGVGASISRQGNAIFSGITTIGSKEVGAGITLSPDGHVSVSGVTTSSTIHIGVDTGVYGEDLVVTGNSRVTGIASFGTSDNPAMHVNIGMSTLSAAPVLTVPDMIKHSGDPETRIRFDTGTVKVETTTIERLRIASGGDVTVKTGNLVIGTAGKGIDFSAQTATSASGASATSELLDHYEEGTWTPTYESVGGTYTFHTQQGFYTKIGNQVSVSAYIRTSNVSATSHNLIKVTGLPFAEGKGQRTPGSVRASSSGFQGTLSNFNFPVTWSVEANQSFAELQRYQDGGNTDLTSSTMNNASYVYLQCTYQTA